MSLIDEMLRDLEHRQREAKQSMVVSGLKIVGGQNPRVVVPRGTAKTRERTGWSSAEFTQIWTHRIPSAVNEANQDPQQLDPSLKLKFFSFFGAKTLEIAEEKKEIPEIVTNVRPKPKREMTEPDLSLLFQEEQVQFQFKKFVLGIAIGLAVIGGGYQWMTINREEPPLKTEIPIETPVETAIEMPMEPPIETQVETQVEVQELQLETPIVEDPYSLEEIASLVVEETERLNQPQLQAVVPHDPGNMRKQFRRGSGDHSKVLERVQGLEQIGREEEAIDLLQGAIVRNPNRHAIREKLAQLYLEKEMVQEANEVLEEGLLQAPGHLPFVKLLARTLVSLERSDQALVVLSKHLPPVSEDPEYHAILGAIYQRVGNHEMAMQTYWHLLDHFPEGGRWWTGLAISLEATGESSGALDGYKRAISDHSLAASLRGFVKERIQTLSVAQQHP